MKEKGSAVQNATSSVNTLSKRIIFIAVSVLIFYIMIKLSFSFGRSLFYVDPAEPAPGTDTEIVITADDDAKSVGERLYEEGVITNALSFRVQGTLYKTDFYPGTYTVNSSMTIKEMLMDIDEKADKLKELASSDGTSETADAAAAEISGGYDGDAVGAMAEGEDMEALEQSDAKASSDENGQESTVELGGGSEGD